MNLHNIRIETDDNNVTKIYVDDKLIEGVKSVNLNITAETLPEITLTVVPYNIDVTTVGNAKIKYATLQ